MPYANGRLPASALAAIPGGRLRKDAAAAWNALCVEAKRRGLPVPRPTSSRVAYRTLAEQHYFWALYRSGRGALAAVPGTSNHGWGLAVDVATPAMRATIDQVGARYGWVKAWSDAPSEWWHLKWRPGRYPAVRPPADPLAVLTATERRQARELRALVRAGQNRRRRAALRRALTRARKRAWRAVKNRPTRHNRQRYALLTNLT